MWGHHLGGVYKEDGSPLGRANPLCQDPASQVKLFVKMYFCLCERRASLRWQDLTIDLPEISPRRAGNFPYKHTY